MNEIGYKGWGMIPVDTDPATGAPAQLQPPMFTAVSMDRDTSLVFAFRTAPDVLHISAEVTALTGEGRGAGLFRLFTGRLPDVYTALPQVQWEGANEGLFVVFRATVPGVGLYLKIFFTEQRPIVLNRIEFSHP